MIMTDHITKLPRLYSDQDLKDGGLVHLPKEQAHYLKNVLRKSEGDGLRLFNGRDGEWLGALQSPGKKEADVLLQQELRPQPPPRRAVHLLFAPIKKARMDMLVEKAVELGVSDLHPVITAHTEVRKLNMERVRAQIIEAAEQCERLDIPRLHDPLALDTVLRGWSGAKIFAALERAEAGHIALTDFEDGPMAFLVGPEGGFSVAESDMLAGHSAVVPVSLGGEILRAETASLMCLSYAKIALVL